MSKAEMRVFCLKLTNASKGEETVIEFTNTEARDLALKWLAYSTNQFCVKTNDRILFVNEQGKLDTREEKEE